MEWQDQPMLVILNLNGMYNIRIDKDIRLNDATFTLSSIAYHGADHYTTRVVRGTHLWYHDGIETGNLLVYEEDIQTANLNNCKARNACNIVYRLTSWHNQFYT